MLILKGTPVGPGRSADALNESEARYLGLVESLPAIVYVAEPEPPYSPLYVSPSIETFGYSREEWFQRSDLWLSLIYPDDQARILHETEVAKAAGRETDYEYRVIARDGSIRWVRDKGRFLLDRTGRAFCWQGLIVDITSQKETQEQLARVYAEAAQSYEDLLAILNHLCLGVALVDRNGQILFISEFCLKILGRQGHEVLGGLWHEVFAFDEHGLAGLKAMIDLPQEQRRRSPMRLQNHSNRWVEIDLRDDPRDPSRKFLVVHDVSDVYNLRRQLRETDRSSNIIGQSAAMQRVYAAIEELAAVDATVLIEGETGTGKELVARAIHFSGPRRSYPFIPLNCAGLSDSLVASQLFGHRKGSFTGASEDRIGLIEAAHKGTIFLDEIGDIPLNVQTHLLRFLQEREIMRLGETRPRQVDVRVVSATFRNLPQEVEKGSFRRDLLYRIQVARLQLPALRHRLEDIPLLVGAFLSEYRQKTGKPIQDISTSAMQILMRRSWLGNVRELKSAVEVALLRSKGSILQDTDFSGELIYGATPAFQTDSPQGSPNDVRSAVEAAGGNRTLAARMLGISRATLYRRLTEAR